MGGESFLRNTSGSDSDGEREERLRDGERLVGAFQGSGDLYLQTRSPESFLGCLIPRLPSRSSNELFGVRRSAFQTVIASVGAHDPASGLRSPT